MEIVETLYPVENAYRQCKNLDGIWHIALATQGENYSNGIPKQNEMIVPADINELDKSPLLNNFVGDIWYQRSFFAPKEWLGQEVYLRFDGVSSVFSVYVNGRCAAFHKEGTILHTIDVTRYINYGEQNKIIVRIENQIKKKPKGILKSVNIYTIPSTRIANYSLFSMQILENAVEINYEINLIGNCLATITVRNEEGSVVATGVGQRGTLHLDNPKLWSFENRSLYTLDFEVSRLGKKCDAYSAVMPLYTLEFTDGEYYLNEKKIELNAIGIKINQIPTNWHAKKFFAQVKAWGYNAIIFDAEVSQEKVLLAQKEGLLVLSQVLKEKIKDLNWW